MGPAMNDSELLRATEKPQTSLAGKAWAHIELADPVTWISATLLTVCGAIASGACDFTNPRDLGLVALGALMTGPFCTGFSQSINDYYDRELDAINDPVRPIPSGRLSLREARINWIVLALATVGVSLIFGNVWIVLLAIFGVLLSAAYSVPPFQLKARFWLGPPAVGIGYVTMSWIAGHLIFAQLTWESVVAALINAGLAIGLLFLNDIKSVEGDRQHGLQSMTVALGVKQTLLVAYGVINVSQLLLFGLALLWGHPWVAGLAMLAILLPLHAQVALYREPSHENFKRYLLASNPFILLIQFISAFVVGGFFG